MYDTDSVFNHLAHTEHEDRQITRKAIALARARVDRTVGTFLRGAVTPEGFSARFAACESQFATHVAEACSEVGCDKAEDVAEVLRDHYAATRRWIPQPITAADEIDPGKEQDSNDGKAVLEPHQDDEDADAPKIKSSRIDDLEGVNLYPGPEQHDNRCPTCGGPAHAPEQGFDNGPLLDTMSQAAQQGVPGMETHPDYRRASTRTADGNTDLGGPEPKMDKKLWTPQNLGEPEVEDGQWPTERKDVVVPIGPPNNEHELKEIDGGGTERVELDSAPDFWSDSGFASGGETSGPHTDTFGGSGQADPVTNTALV